MSLPIEGPFELFIVGEANFTSSLKEQNFRESPIRHSVPLGGDFFTPGMRVMNDIFANDDGTDNYLIQGLTRPPLATTHSYRKDDSWDAHDGALAPCRTNLQVNTSTLVS